MYDSFASFRVTMSSCRSSAAFADRRPSSTVSLSITILYRRRCASMVLRYRFTSSSVSCALWRCAMAAYRRRYARGRKRAAARVLHGQRGWPTGSHLLRSVGIR